jgi:anti-sigma regulatory factor (Ser/Thr protein kinase)
MVDARAIHEHQLSQRQREGTSCPWCSAWSDARFPIPLVRGDAVLTACTKCAGRYGLPQVLPALSSYTPADWSAVYPMAPRSARRARADTRRQIAEWRWGGDPDRGVLAVSELVSNAVDHASAFGPTLILRLELLDLGRLLVDVVDPWSSFPDFGEWPMAEPLDPSGRGMHAVQDLGADVTWFPLRDGGKTVRAELPVTVPEAWR